MCEKRTAHSPAGHASPHTMTVAKALNGAAMTPSSRPRRGRVLAVLAAGLILVASVAEARPGRGGFGFGSRGSRTFDAPSVTQTAPRAATPITRSATRQNPAAGNLVNRPNGGFLTGRGGLMGGLLGAGLFGMLLGYGFAGGLGGLGSLIGFALQILVIGLLVSLALRFFRNRNRPAAAYAGGGMGGMTAGGSPASTRRGGAGAMFGGGRNAGARGEPIEIVQGDYDAFERLLTVVQDAYGREDVNGLRAAATPEIASYLEQELAENAARGVVNRVSDAKLLQGDLAEAWREGGTEYATVAMRFSLIDHTVERASGRTVEGDPTRPVEATELWTFTRPRGGQWELSAIQPA